MTSTFTSTTPGDTAPDNDSLTRAVHRAAVQ